VKQSDSPDDPNHLPDNLPECHNLITSLRGEVKELKATMAEEVKKLTTRISELEKQLSRRNRMVFGKKSAKVDSTLLTGTGKAVHIQTNNELDAEKKD
jgi:hypothetical protein